MLTDNENDEEDSGLSSAEGDLEILDFSNQIFKNLYNLSHERRNNKLIFNEASNFDKENVRNDENGRSNLIPVTLQHFLTSLCEFQVPKNERSRIGIRYFKTPEVQNLMKKLENSTKISTEVFQTDANVIISVLKELLTHIPIFHDENEEFICVSLHCSIEFAIIYVQGLIETLPKFLQNFTYLVCKSLKNLAQQSSGTIIDAYTDLLLLFTPVLFPHSVAEISRFLRATRISLILIDLCDFVFKKFCTPEILDGSGDEDFFKEIFQSLSQLETAIYTSDDLSKIKDPTIEFNLSLNEEVPKNLNNSEISGYYQITYVE